MKRRQTKNMKRALQWLRDHGFMGPDEDLVIVSYAVTVPVTDEDLREEAYWRSAR